LKQKPLLGKAFVQVENAKSAGMERQDAAVNKEEEFYRFAKMVRSVLKFSSFSGFRIC
jgi:hypothetical protein